MRSIDPTTGNKIKTYAEYSLAMVNQALKEVQSSFVYWHNLPINKRAEKMNVVAEILRKNKETYARLMAEEMGKPMTQGRSEIDKCAMVCEFYAEHAITYLNPQPVQTKAKKSFVSFQPLGVILAVMPWNFPFWQVFRCAAPTLMAGNAVVLKHASNVCGCALAIEDIFKAAGIAPAVFKTLLISNEKVGALIKHPVIKAVTLTGSTGAGQAIASQAGAALKKTVLELGGSDPYIVLEDADVPKAAQICAESRLINGGQSCVSAKRFIVVESRLKEFEQHFVEHMKLACMGSPLREDTTMGPLARHDLRDALHRQVQKSIKQGASLLLGGKVPALAGAFYPPTVLTNVTKGSPAYDEELFGPAAAIISVRDEGQAIAVANDTVFGLGSAIFTEDLKRAQEIAEHQLEAGCCFINDMVVSDPHLPFGGIKQSGYGRELAGFGIHEFTNVKTISIK